MTSMGKVQVARAERLHRLCKSIVAAGPHSVDDDIKARFKSAVLRYAGTQYIETQKALENIYQGEGEIGRSVRKAFAVIAKADDDDDRGHTASDDPGAPVADFRRSRAVGAPGHSEPSHGFRRLLPQSFLQPIQLLTPRGASMLGAWGSYHHPRTIGWA
jgi:hypothetical protein